jgi:hypothetical protein
LGAGAAGAGLLPLLQEPTAHAAGTPPKRLIIVTWVQGAVERSFWPEDGGTWDQPGPTSEFPLTDQHFADQKANGVPNTLAPLRPHAREINILRGIDIASGYDDRLLGNGHHANPHVLTGMGKATVSSPGGPSLDQYVARAIAKASPTRLDSIVAGVFTESRYPEYGPVSATGRGLFNAAENNPHKLYERIFGVDSGGGQRLAARRALVDHVGRQLERMARRLSQEDRLKIEAHLASARQIEKELLPLDLSSMCQPPDIGPPLALPRPIVVNTPADVEKSAIYPKVGKLQMDLIVSALACDQTRVALLQWSTNSGTDIAFSWLGSEYVRPSESGGGFGKMMNYHEIAHGSATPGVGAAVTKDGPWVSMKARIDRWYVEQLAYLLAKLKSVREGDGTLLDNSVVLFINCYGSGVAHWNFHIPTIVAGGCQGYFKTGRYIRFPRTRTARKDYQDWFNTPHNGLLVSLANAVGVPTTTFGDPRYGSGELARLRG